MTTTRALPDETRRFLSLLARPGDVFELRALVRVNGQQHVNSGYFDNVEDLVRAASAQSGNNDGVYVTLNPVLDALLARRKKNTVSRAGGSDTTSDRDVRVRRSLLVDVDPIRPAGISSTDAEHAAALELAWRIAADLSDLGWPDPILADSGNGAHLIYAVDLPVDDAGLIRRVLVRLSRTYSNDTLKVDEKVFNPARISKIYGTLTRKGENTPERPHRFARIIAAPDALETLSRDVLDSFAPDKPATRELRQKVDRYANERAAFDLDEWIATHLQDARPRDWSSGRKWILPVCPFNDQHDRGEAFITQKSGDGSISAGCLHESCFSTWKELREHFEPGIRERRDAWEQRSNGNGHRRLTDREPPPEVLYEDESYAAEIDAIAERDREPQHRHPIADVPTAPSEVVVPKWKRAPDLADEVWARKDDPWIALALGPDELMSIRAGATAVVMGGSGSGKSSLVANLLVQHAMDAGPAIAMSIELPADELAARIVGTKCDASWEDALRGRVPLEHMRIALNMPRLYVLEREHATLANLRACARAARSEYPGQPLMAAIDYAQLVDSDEKDARMRVSDALRQIDKVTRDERMATIAVSQMSRASAKQARDGERIGKDSADLGAESAAIERYSTITLSIGKMGEPREDGSQAVELSIGKARMSGRGDTVIEMSYWGRTGRWRANGEPKSATKVREERDVEKVVKLEKSLENELVGILTASKAPMSRNSLVTAIGRNKKLTLKKIEQLLATGAIVEVNQTAVRSRFFMIWTLDRARDAKMPLVKDTPLLGDD